MVRNVLYAANEVGRLLVISKRKPKRTPAAVPIIPSKKDRTATVDIANGLDMCFSAVLSDIKL
jgi:hypothetical protein